MDFFRQYSGLVEIWCQRCRVNRKFIARLFKCIVALKFDTPIERENRLFERVAYRAETIEHQDAKAVTPLLLKVA